MVGERGFAVLMITVIVGVGVVGRGPLRTGPVTGASVAEAGAGEVVGAGLAAWLAIVGVSFGSVAGA